MQDLNLDAQAWAELNRLLDSALDLPAAERERWLDQLAPEHQAIKPRLRHLLSRAALTGTGDFLHTLPKLDVDLHELSPLDSRPDQAGDTIGPYRLIRELGAGGMGVVWLAERIDGLINRPVALKLPHGAWRRAGLAERMAREREILATLAHPHIARLYDAGLSSDGQPYLAIEYVEGEPIDQYCSRRQLALKSRVELFAQVANAVAYAHGKLVVHRDLKPQNILVTSDGQVRLLDFGIAKLLDDGQTKETVLTEISGRALTLDYASPEQILGEPLSIATDVYSLGVVLYELLAGTRPFQRTGDSRGGLEAAILQADPPRPSEVAGPAERKALRGDLDTVVLKALEKTPEDRYATVNAFVDDLFRCLDHRPVLAQPASRRYRLGKFVGRHKWSVAASAMVLLAVVVGAGVAFWQARIAHAEQQRADEVRKFIVAIFDDANPYQQGGGRALTGVELLRLAKDRIERIDRARVELRLELCNTLGGSLLALEDPDAARAVLQKGIDEAAPSLDPVHPQMLHAQRLLAQVYRVQDKPRESRALLDAVLPALRQRARQDPAELVAALRELANIESRETNWAAVETVAHDGLTIVRDRLGDRSPEKVTLLSLLYSSHRFRGEFAASLAAAHQAYAAASDLYPDGNHPQKVDARYYYALALENAGQGQQAAAEMRAVLQDTSALLGPGSRRYGQRLSATYSVFTEAGFVQEGVVNAERGREVLANHVARDSRLFAAATENLALAYLDARRGDRAAEHLNAALAVYQREFGPVHQYVTITQRNIGNALVYAGRLDEAEKAMSAALADPAIIAKDGYDLNAYISGIRDRLAGRYREALALQEHALTSVPAGSSYAMARAQIGTEIGLNLVELGQFADAAAPLSEAVRSLTSLQAQATPRRADAWVGLARAELGLKRPDEALPLLMNADQFWRDFDQEHRWAGEAALWLGRCYLALGRGADADLALVRAGKILSRSRIPADARLVAISRQR